MEDAQTEAHSSLLLRPQLQQQTAPEAVALTQSGSITAHYSRETPWRLCAISSKTVPARGIRQVRVRVINFGVGDQGSVMQVLMSSLVCEFTYSVEKDRYHLYVSLACPFACRVVAVLNLKGLQDVISVSVVHPLFQRTRPDDSNDTHNGWAFVDPEVTPFLPGPTGIGKYSSKGCNPDPVMNAKFVRDLYEFAKTAPTRFSVPLLWDKHTNTVVSNESADMMRMFNTEFEDLAPSKINLYPSALRNEIDEVNEWVTEHINNGVYKVGFATTQQGYDTAVRSLYAVIDRMEEILSKQRYLVGSQITEADLRLFETLIRFDEVYVVQFKANGKLIQDYPNLFNYLKDLYQVPEIGATVNMDHIKSSYFGSQLNMNPFGIVPAGPNVDYASPHDRDRFSK